MVTAEISVQPEVHATVVASYDFCDGDQKIEVRVETPSLPKSWDLDDILACSCGYLFTGAEERAVVNAGRRKFQVMTGADLRHERRRVRLTQRELAERMGLHRNTVARLERDEWPISRRLAGEFWDVLILAQMRRAMAAK
jgi:DNA-binding XRE family transcriptional regulator